MWTVATTPLTRPKKIDDYDHGVAGKGSVNRAVVVVQNKIAYDSTALYLRWSRFDFWYGTPK